MWSSVSDSPRPLPYKSFAVYHLLIIEPLDAVECQVLTAYTPSESRNVRSQWVSEHDMSHRYVVIVTLARTLTH
jgi:hypothetical protein